MSIRDTLAVQAKNLLNRGFFHILGSTLTNKLIVFASNILIVRFLTQDEYGVFSYANSIYSIVLLFTGLGLISGLLQFSSEKRPVEEKFEIQRYVLTVGLFIDAVIMMLLVFVGYGAGLSIAGSGHCLAMLAPLIPLDYFFQYASSILRSRKLNKEYSLLLNVNTIGYTGLSCVGAFAAGVPGVISGRYAAYAITISVAVILLKGVGFPLRSTKFLSSKKAVGLWKFSLPTGISSVFNSVVYLLDVLMVGIIVASSIDVACYKVATMLPEGFLFIPQCIVIFALPYFAEHRLDSVWFSKHARVLLFGSLVPMAVIAVVLFIWAPDIIKLLWGEEYVDAATAFRIISLSLIVSPLRTVSVNLLACLHRVRFNLVVSVVSLAANVALTVPLTFAFGIVGAALATVSTTVLVSLLSLRGLRSSLKESDK